MTFWVGVGVGFLLFPVVWVWVGWLSDQIPEGWMRGRGRGIGWPP